MVLEANAGVRYSRTLDTRVAVRESSLTGPRPPKLLDRVREANRLRHGSRSTEKSYVVGVRRSVLKIRAPRYASTHRCRNQRLPRTAPTGKMLAEQEYGRHEGDA